MNKDYITEKDKRSIIRVFESYDSQFELFNDERKLLDKLYRMI